MGCKSGPLALGGGGRVVVLLTLDSGSAPVWGRARWVWGAPRVQSRAGCWFIGLRGGELDQEGRGASPRAAPPSVCLKAVYASAMALGSDPCSEALMSSQCLSVSLGLKWVSCRQHMYVSSFCIHSASLCLLVGAFNPFTFKVIIDIYMFLLPFSYCLGVVL